MLVLTRKVNLQDQISSGSEPSKTGCRTIVKDVNPRCSWSLPPIITAASYRQLDDSMA